MPVAIDTSVLISAEKEGDFDKLLPESTSDRLKERIQLLRTFRVRLKVQLLRLGFRGVFRALRSGLSPAPACFQLCL